MSAVGDQAMQGVSPVVPCLSCDCAFGSLRELICAVVIRSDRLLRPEVMVCAMFYVGSVASWMAMASNRCEFQSLRE
jgi:hypothetical protein